MTKTTNSLEIKNTVSTLKNKMLKIFLYFGIRVVET